MDYVYQRGDARLKASTKFATLSIKMQLTLPTEIPYTIEIGENIAAVTMREIMTKRKIIFYGGSVA